MKRLCGELCTLISKFQVHLASWTNNFHFILYFVQLSNIFDIQSLCFVLTKINAPHHFVIMPPCKGRPNGPCPNNQDDSSVSWSIADIFLCKDCNDFRFGGGKTSDNTLSTDIMLTATTNVTSPLTLRNEILCFIQQNAAGRTPCQSLQ